MRVKVSSFYRYIYIHMYVHIPFSFQRDIALDELSDLTKEFVTVYPLGSRCIATTGILTKPGNR